MDYSSMAAAIKKIRAKKMRMEDFHTDESLQEGNQDLLREEKDGETDLAPGVKKQDKIEIDIEQHDDSEPQVEVQKSEKVPVINKDMEMRMQDDGLDQGDAVLPAGMYQEGDEKKKGFMGKAARLMMEKLKKG